MVRQNVLAVVRAVVAPSCVQVAAWVDARKLRQPSQSMSAPPPTRSGISTCARTLAKADTQRAQNRVDTVRQGSAQSARHA